MRFFPSHRLVCLFLFLGVCDKRTSVAEGCRWALVASSRPTAAAELFSDPVHSLARQSYAPPFTPLSEQARLFDSSKAAARDHDVNMDGWGLGWFEPENGTGTALAHRARSGRSCVDAKTHQLDPELSKVMSEVSSNVLLAHIRAATDGDTSPQNSHPFQYGSRLLFLHNGGVHRTVQRRLRDKLSCPEISKLLRGQTDSEFAGALFAQGLDGDVCLRSKRFSAREMETAMDGVIQAIQNKTDGADEHSSLNFAAADGDTVVVTRYRTEPNEEPPSLYVAVAATSDSGQDQGDTLLQLLLEAADSGGTAEGVANNQLRLWVASEPLDGSSACVAWWNSSAQCLTGSQHARTWVPIPKDMMLTFDYPRNTLKVKCLSKACLAELQFRSMHVMEKQSQWWQCGYTLAATALFGVSVYALLFGRRWQT